MSIKTVHTEPFQSGQQTNAKGKSEPVKRIANASNDRSADPSTGIDHLTAALAHRGPPLLPADTHIWTHTTRVEPVGANYGEHVRGEYGSVKPRGQGRGVYSYGGAPNRKGDNPLGSNSNRKGGNPLGRNSERHGHNALGKAMNRVGTNALVRGKTAPKGGGGGRHV